MSKQKTVYGLSESAYNKFRKQRDELFSSFKKETVADVLNVPESDIPEEQKGVPVFTLPESKYTTAVADRSKIKPQTLTPEESAKLVGGIQGAERGGAPLTSEKEIENANKLALMVDTLEVGVDMLSPVSSGRAVVEGVKSAVQKAKESGQALGRGEIIEGLTGFAVAEMQGVMAGLSALTPQMAGFNYATNIAGTIAPEATQTAMQPITSLTKPETEIEKNLAELGDVGATLLVAFGANIGKAVVGKYGKSIPKNILDSAKKRIESFPSLKTKFDGMITPEVTKATPEDLAGANIRKVSTKRGDRYVDLNTNKMVSKKEASDLLKQSREAKNAVKEGEIEQSNIPQREEVSPRGISEETGSRNIVEESGKIQEEIANIESTDIAYHGTPYNYESFDTSKIGTGEGAAMRGKGLYLSRNKHLAPFFANINSPDAPIHIGKGKSRSSGEINPRILTVSGIDNLNLFKGSTRDIGKLVEAGKQKDFVNQGYDGFEMGNGEIVVFPESIHKVQILKKSTIEEFIKANPDTQFREWTTEPQEVASEIQKEIVPVAPTKRGNQTQTSKPDTPFFTREDLIRQNEKRNIQKEIADIKTANDALAVVEKYKDNPEAIKILEQEKVKRDAEQQRAKEEYIKDDSEANENLLSQKNTEAQVIGEALQKIKVETPKPEPTLPTETAEAPIEGTPTKTSKDINKILVEKGFEALPEAELAKYTPQTRASQIGKITDLVTSNFDNTVKMMSKEMPIPDDINPRLLFNAVIEKATADKNGAVLRELAKSPFNTETSLAGQTLSFTARNKPDYDPLTAINEVTTSRSQSGIGKTVKYLEDRITTLEQQLSKKEVEQTVRKTQAEIRRTKRARTQEELSKEWDDINKELFVVLSKPHAGVPVDAIPLVGKMMVNLVERGVTKVADIVDTIYEQLRDKIEGLDKKSIQEAISKYSAGLSKEEITNRVKELEKQLPEARLESDKARITKQIEEYNRRINEGDYSTPERQPRLTDPEKVKLQRKLSETRERYNKVKKDLGDLITADEAQKIANLSNEVQTAKDKMDNSERRKVGEGATPEELEFGLKQVDFEHYVNTLKFSKSKTTLEQFKARPLLATGEMLKNTAQISRSMVSSLDNSWHGRQGLRVLFTQDVPDLLTALPRNLLGMGNKDIPRFIWSKTLAKSFEVMYRTFRKQDIARTIRAEMISDPMYKKLQDAGIALGTVEEAFPSDFKSIDRVPLLGRSYRATETAYTTSAHYMRYQVGKRILQIAEASGVDTNDKFQLQSIGRLVNDLTARGKIGNKPERQPGIINAVIWSPKMLAAHINTITAPLRGTEYSNFARVEASKNILKIGASIGAIQMIANSIRPGSAETNPLSSDWGKVKIGNRTIDYTGGMGTFITLLSRIYKQEMIDKGGVKKEIGLKTFGSQNTLDLIYGFLEGKTAPVASEVVSHLKGESREITPEGEREKPTILRSLLNLYIPLSARNTEELLQTDFGMEIAAYATLDALGFSVKDYRPISKTGKFLKSLNETDREEMLKILNLESEVQALKAKGLEQKDKEMLREYLTKSAELNKAKRTPLYRQYLSKGQETKKKNEEILRSAR